MKIVKIAFPMSDKTNAHLARQTLALQCLDRHWGLRTLKAIRLKVEIARLSLSDLFVSFV